MENIYPCFLSSSSSPLLSSSLSPPLLSPPLLLQVAEVEARRKKSALSHSMMRELKQQMFDTPEEISHEQVPL